MTIVGSAAFNLLLVSAICVAAVPDGETRAIRNHGVFFVTAVASILAYAWLIAILTVWTPDVVTVWEAVLTLGFLPALVYLSYSADKGDLQKRLVDLDELIAVIEEKTHESIKATEELVEKGVSMKKGGVTMEKGETVGLTKLANESGLTAVAGFLEKSDTASDDPSDDHDTAEERRKGWELSRLMALYELDGVRRARRRFKVELEEGDAYVYFKPFQVAAILQGNTKKLSVQRAAQVVAWVGQQKTRADYRMQASHIMMGEPTGVTSNALLASGKKGLLNSAIGATEERFVGFASHSVVCSEADGSVTVNVERQGDITSMLRVDYYTRDGTAKGGPAPGDGVDYEHAKGTLVFEPYESQLSISVVIFSDYTVEDDETFEILLTNPVDGKQGAARRGRREELAGTRLSQAKVEVTIMDDNTRGSVGFDQTNDTKGAVYTVVESAGHACIPVRRRGSTGQNMSCRFRTFQGSANPGLAGQKSSEYENTYERGAGGLDGELVFMPGEMVKDIVIDVFDTESYFKSQVFYVQLIDPQNCELRNLTVAQVTITHDIAVQAFATSVIVQLAKDALTTQPRNRYRVQRRVQVRRDFDPQSEVIAELEVDHEIESLETRRTDDGRVRIRFAEYKDARRSIKGISGWCSVVAADGEVLLAPIASKKTASLLSETKSAAVASIEDVEKQTVWMIMLRVALLPWRLVCSWTPPPALRGGWPCFLVALVLICMVTVVICELAGLVSCAVGTTPSTIAVVLIAGGTSLPDLYASRSAAISDATADSAIGNVMGSNAVNVFLGLGLPWSVAAIYWQIVGASPEWLERVGEDFPHLPQIYPAGGFVVPARDLCFAAGTFLLCAFVFVGMILSRRRRFGYELGGEERMEAGAVFFFMWLVFIFLSICEFHGIFDTAEALLRGEDEAAGSGGAAEDGSWSSTLWEEGSSSWNTSMSDGFSESGSGDPAHDLLQAVMWVFMGLACTGSAIVCMLKHEREEHAQLLRDQIAETRSMMYMEHGETHARARTHTGWRFDPRCGTAGVGNGSAVSLFFDYLSSCPACLPRVSQLNTLLLLLFGMCRQT